LFLNLAFLFNHTGSSDFNGGYIYRIELCRPEVTMLFVT